MIAVEDLVVRYGSATALDGVSLTVRPGEMVALVGPNGAGKSTLVDTLSGVLRPASGRVHVAGALAHVPEGRQLFADLTVEDDLPPAVLASGAAWAGCVAGAMSERVFANKLRAAGFADIRLDQRTPFGIDDVALYPLFTAELIALMRRLVPADSHDQIAWSVLATARKPGSRSSSRS